MTGDFSLVLKGMKLRWKVVDKEDLKSVRNEESRMELSEKGYAQRRMDRTEFGCPNTSKDTESQ
eukprot:11356997-Ditylum_brightwellii.AAC.1